MNSKDSAKYWEQDSLRPIVSPSLLCADFACLKDEIDRVPSASWLHFDVMDGHFVPNLSFGAPLIKAMRPRSEAFFDVHIMATEQENFLDAILEAGADCVTIHGEADPHVRELLQKIKDHGCRAGIALCPDTPATFINEVIDMIDLVLVMGVNPGFGGQAFMDNQLDKIAEIKSIITKSGRSVLLSVDGGVKLTNAPGIVAKGADVLVVGTAIFGAADADKAVQAFASIKG